MVLIHTTLGRGTLKLGLKFYSLGSIFQYWLETGGERRISLGKLKQAVDMRYKYCTITSVIVSLFLLRRWDMREMTSPESLEKISHSVSSSLKSFLNGNYTLHYIPPVNNLINNKILRE